MSPRTGALLLAVVALTALLSLRSEQTSVAPSKTRPVKSLDASVPKKEAALPTGTRSSLRKRNRAVKKPQMVDGAVAPASEPLTVDGLKAEGIFNAPSHLVPDVFTSEVWTQISDLSYEHENGSIVKVSAVGGYVTMVRMDFSPELPSAAMQNVLDYVIGHEHGPPFDLETLAMATSDLDGRFEQKNGSKLRYRGDRTPYLKTDKKKAWLIIELE